MNNRHKSCFKHNLMAPPIRINRSSPYRLLPGDLYMSYVNPKLNAQFESLSIDLKNEILSRDVHLDNLQDLIAVLEQIVQEDEAAP